MGQSNSGPSSVGAARRDGAGREGWMTGVGRGVGVVRGADPFDGPGTPLPPKCFGAGGSGAGAGIRAIGTGSGGSETTGRAGSRAGGASRGGGGGEAGGARSTRHVLP